jgi:hypothetical protein
MGGAGMLGLRLGGKHPSVHFASMIEDIVLKENTFEHYKKLNISVA